MERSLPYRGAPDKYLKRSYETDMFARENHSSLFEQSLSDEDKKFLKNTAVFYESL